MVNNDILLLIAVVIVGAPSIFWLVHHVRSQRAREADVTELPYVEPLDLERVLRKEPEDLLPTPGFVMHPFDPSSLLILTHYPAHVIVLEREDRECTRAIESSGISELISSFMDGMRPSPDVVFIPEERPKFMRRTREPRQQLPNRIHPQGRSLARPRSGPRR